MTPGKFIEVFDTVAEAPGGVKRLRELVLQLAVRGRLVRQDADDEPAAVLLRRIADEKARRGNQIKTRKPLPKIQDDELPFGIPVSWEWTHLGEITSYGAAEKAEPGEVSEETWVLVHKPCGRLEKHWICGRKFLDQLSILRRNNTNEYHYANIYQNRYP